jgi:hypothetical protein
MIILLIASVTIASIVAYRIGRNAGRRPPKLRATYFPQGARETFVATESESVRMFRAKQAQARVTFQESND